MSRNALIAITIGAIIILGAIAAFLYSQTRPSTDELDSSKMAKEAEAPDEGMSLATVADIFTRGENQMCTFEAGGDEGVTTGTVYVSGDSARGEFTTTISNDESYETYMIRNDDTFYMWGDSFPTGMKMVMSVDEWANQIIDDTEESSVNSAIDPNAEVDFKCSSWTVDRSLFEAPTDVKFMTIEGSIGEDAANLKMIEDEDGESIDQCNICNSLTGDAKSICLEQFNCQ
jgi:hypothetical protein